MHWKRLGHLFDRSRWSVCRERFRHPLLAAIQFCFVNRQPFDVTTTNGRTLTFSRDGRDHKFWDWYFQNPVPLQFTEDGCVVIDFENQLLQLRPGSADFTVFSEVYLQDEYGIRRSDRRYGTVIDLGANCGMFSCAILQSAERVISVEAVAANHTQAVRNITANGGNENNVLHVAVAAMSGETIRLYHNPRNSGGHSTAAEWTQRDSGSQSDYETVRTISLADLLDSQDVDHVDLLKCDIEGAEYDVFLPATNETLSRISEIVMEVHISPAHPPDRLQTLVSRFRNAGFQVQLDRDIPETDRIDSFVMTAVQRRTIGDLAESQSPVHACL